MTSNQYFPQTIPHPGAILDEKLKEMGMSNKEFALRTDKPEKTITAILKGSSGITPEMAIKFENVTQIPANFWIRYQQRYNEFKTREKLQIIVDNAEPWAREFPYAEMAKLNWLPATRDIKEKTKNLLIFFGIASHKGWESLYIESELKVAAYTSLKQSHEPHAISAWLRQGEIQAKKVPPPVFDICKVRSNIPAMRQLMVDHPVDFFRQLQHLCLEAGVILLYTPKLPKVPLSGSTRWINDHPLIQLTARYKQNDRFWFTFFHELGHIVLHGKKYISLENIDFAAADPEKEAQANDFAEKYTFSKEQEEKLLREHPTYISPNDIINSAKEFNAHPAMIVGRLQHLGLIHFSTGREFIVSVNLADHA